ncbi:MAG: AMP-binding protein [Clostridia bacterium]|nr:AMP-binding protein [Clostridia bacterium]
MRMINNLKGAKPPKVISNLRHLVTSGAECFGDRTLYFYKERNGEYAEYSYSRLLTEMNRLGTAFSLLGIGDQHIAVSGDTHPRWIATYLACINGNGCIVPIDKELSAEATADFLKFGECVCFVYTAAQNEKAKELSALCPEIRYFIPIEPEEDFRFSDKVYTVDEILEMGEKAISEGNDSYLQISLEMEKMSALIFTSGTTGTSKGVMLSHRNLTAATNASVLSMSYDDRNTFVSVLPPHHTYEITCGHLAIMDLGAQIFINDSLKHVLKNFKSFQPNALMLVPLFVETMHKRIWDEVRKKGLEKQMRALIKMNSALLSVRLDIRGKLFKQVNAAFGGNLKSIVCGGAPLSPDLIKDFYAFGITVLEGYGITECAPLVSVNSPGKIKFRSVGTPVKGCTVMIDKKPEEETGEILVKGDNVMMGYYKNEEATAEAFTEDGWFRTGDIGYMDDEGYIFITGRKKNVIILSNGKNVFPEELEEYLAAVPAILESVVLARTNDLGEQTITAIVVPNEEILAGKNKDEIYAEIKTAVNNINRKLPSFKHIRKIEVRYDKFERTTSKKIQRFKVN